MHRSVLPPAVPEVEPGDGGIGHSWFAIELTSADVSVGGVGYSWFEIELTSDHVPVDEVPPVEPPVTTPSSFGGISPARQRRKLRQEQRFPGHFSAIRSDKDAFSGRFIVFKYPRFAGTYELVESTSQTFEAGFNASILRARQREEEEFLFLIDDE